MRKGLWAIATALAGGLAGLAVDAPRAHAETIELRRADGAVMKARLVGEWSEGCPPTLILSHGLGGDERVLAYLDAPAVAAGYRVLVMEHRASGLRALIAMRLRGDMEDALRGADVWQGRARDLDAAISYATQRCRPDPFVLGGHSLGAALTMIEAGAQGRPPFAGARRFDGYIALSPQGVGWAFAEATAWATVTDPVLLVTGTEDAGLDGSWETRLDAWHGLPAGHKRLAVLDGAAHRELGGRGGTPAEADAGRVVGEFLRQLRGDAWAGSALNGVNAMQVSEK